MKDGGDLGHLRLWADGQVEICRLNIVIEKQAALIDAFKKELAK